MFPESYIFNYNFTLTVHVIMLGVTFFIIHKFKDHFQKSCGIFPKRFSEYRKGGQVTTELEYLILYALVFFNIYFIMESLKF